MRNDGKNEKKFWATRNIHIQGPTPGFVTRRRLQVGFFCLLSRSFGTMENNDNRTESHGQATISGRIFIPGHMEFMSVGSEAPASNIQAEASTSGTKETRRRYDKERRLAEHQTFIKLCDLVQVDYWSSKVRSLREVCVAVDKLITENNELREKVHFNERSQLQFSENELNILERVGMSLSESKTAFLRRSLRIYLLGAGKNKERNRILWKYNGEVYEWHSRDGAKG